MYFVGSLQNPPKNEQKIMTSLQSADNLGRTLCGNPSAHTSARLVHSTGNLSQESKHKLLIIVSHHVPNPTLKYLRIGLSCQEFMDLTDHNLLVASVAAQPGLDFDLAGPREPGIRTKVKGVNQRTGGPITDNHIKQSLVHLRLL